MGGIGEGGFVRRGGDLIGDCGLAEFGPEALPILNNGVDRHKNWQVLRAWVCDIAITCRPFAIPPLYSFTSSIAWNSH